MWEKSCKHSVSIGILELTICNKLIAQMSEFHLVCFQFGPSVKI